MTDEEITVRKKHLRVVLPWPAYGLSPNARLHWAVKRKLVLVASRVAFAAVYSKTAGRRAVPDGRIGYRCTFFPPDRRARDEDNLIASLKSSLDGIAQALRIDDKCFHLLEPAVREPDRPHGHVEIDLFWREEH